MYSKVVLKPLKKKKKNYMQLNSALNISACLWKLKYFLKFVINVQSCHQVNVSNQLIKLFFLPGRWTSLKSLFVEFRSMFICKETANNSVQARAERNSSLSLLQSYYIKSTNLRNKWEREPQTKTQISAIAISSLVMKY